MFQEADKIVSRRKLSLDALSWTLSEQTVVKRLNTALGSTPLFFEVPDSNRQAVMLGT
jgi:hypothetical protein